MKSGHLVVIENGERLVFGDSGAGLVPLFPTFALIAHYIVGKGRSVDDLKTTIVFGMWSIIPYFVYLATLYVLVDRLRLEASLALAAVAWLMAATVLVSVWVRLH